MLFIDYHRQDNVSKLLWSYRMLFFTLLLRTWANITKTPFIHSVLLLTSGTIIGQILALLATPIISRLYTPDEYGILGSYTSIIAIGSVVAMLRYEVAIPGSDSDSDAGNLLILTLVIGLCTSIIYAFVCLFIIAPLGALLNIQALVPYLWLVPIGIFVIALYQALSHWAIRNQDFSTLAKTKLIQSASMTSVQIMLGIFSFGQIGLILGKILGQGGGCGIILRKIIGQNQSLLRSVSLGGLLDVGLRYNSFPKYSAIAALMGAAYINLPPLFFVTLYGTTIGGWYILVMDTLLIPINLMSVSITQAYFGELVKLKQSSSDNILSISWHRLKQLSILGIVIVFLLNIVAPFLIPLVFGPQWASTVKCLQILSPMVLISFITAPFGCIIDVFQRQDLHLIREIVRLSVIIIAMTSIYLLNVNWMVAMSLYSGAGIISYSFYIWISWLAIRSRTVIPQPIVGI